ncbi:MAG: TIGR01440 family protein [Ruminococcaceae bacterium]|nr:TIGR01440 family protein [Oscillospiraceae bacterium]
MLNDIRTEARAAMEALLAAARPEPGALVVVGCSTSEVAGHKIGTVPGPEIAAALLEGMLPPLQAAGLYLAAQCCEHLGRALIVEQAAWQAHRLERVNAIPQPKAGGSFATAAWGMFAQPVAVAAIQAAAGLDIGHTLIGMHLRPVVVPVRLGQKAIGQAPLVAARTRPRFVGGARAIYDETLM